MSEIYSNQLSELIAHPQATSELLGAPSIFGNETSEYTACQFITAFERCIKLNPVLMANHEFRLAYFGSKLRAAPQDWFSNLEELHDETLESWNSLCAAFKLQFSLTRSQWQTRFEMHEISQGQRSVADYTNHFRSLANKLPKYGEEALLTQYLFGLNRSVQSHLGSLPLIPEVLSELIAVCIEFGGRIPISNLNSLPVASSNRVVERFKPTSPLSRKRPNSGPLSPSERKYRTDHNLCIYCGDPNHFVADCPNKTKN